MKESGRIIILVLVIFGFFSSYSSLNAEEISQDIAAFRAEFYIAMDQINKVKAGKKSDSTTLSASMNNMRKIVDSKKQRVAGKRQMEKGTDPRRAADEAALKKMQDQVNQAMREMNKQKVEQDKASAKEYLAKIMDLIKEMREIQRRINVMQPY